MNHAAYEALREAQRAYLRANGWMLTLHPGEVWLEPHGYKRLLDLGHATNSQLKRDRESIPLRPPETPEETLARYRGEVRRAFYERHDEGRGPFSSRRQEVRRWIRAVSRLTTPVTRVEIARAARAAHASKHRPTGCACGKEGPPW